LIFQTAFQSSLVKRGCKHILAPQIALWVGDEGAELQPVLTPQG